MGFMRSKRCLGCFVGSFFVIYLFLTLYALEVAQLLNNRKKHVVDLRSSLLKFAPRAENQRDCRRVIILKDGRSGSKWMSALINSQPDVFILNELKKPTGEPGTELAVQLKKVLQFCPAQASRVYGVTLDVKYMMGEKVFTGPDSLDLGKTLGEIGNVAVVLYARTNLVKHAIAYSRNRIYLEKCGDNHRKKGSKCFLGPVNITKGSLKQNLYVLQRVHRKMKSLAETSVTTAAFSSRSPISTYLTVFYEDAVQDPLRFLDGFFAFLNPPGQKLPVPELVDPAGSFLKNTPEDLKTIVPNWLELHSYLTNTPW
mmetsp:Transcript_4956/g.5809  ORF Transcript_4956/g.5809 Transcript_4956/m.5809 type:complete len:313 (+) Transcript_4956:49-987(+)